MTEDKVLEASPAESSEEETDRIHFFERMKYQHMKKQMKMKKNNR